MNNRPKLKHCPFCGREISIQTCDAEGNHRPDDYADDPWSGLGFLLRHEIPAEGTYCPIATHEGEDIGTIIYGSKDSAIERWNTRTGEPK